MFTIFTRKVWFKETVSREMHAFTVGSIISYDQYTFNTNKIRVKSDCSLSSSNLEWKFCSKMEPF